MFAIWWPQYLFLHPSWWQLVVTNQYTTLSGTLVKDPASPEHWPTLPSGNSWETSARTHQTLPVYSQYRTGNRNRSVPNLHLWTVFYLSIMTQRFTGTVTHSTIFSLTANGGKLRPGWWVCKHGTAEVVVLEEAVITQMRDFCPCLI